MKITILKTGDVPESLRERFSPYPEMFSRMFAEAGGDFTHDVVAVNEGEPLPAPEVLDGVVITGSSAGVYEDHAWLDPLRAFIRKAYETKGYEESAVLLEQVSLKTDSVFRDGWKDQMAKVKGSVSDGYVASLKLAV